MFLCYKRQAVKNSHEIVVISSVKMQARYLKSFSKHCVREPEECLR